jgi:hypothetical protein
MSSGQQQYIREQHRTCDTCYWDGDVEVVFDPEVNGSWWDCPQCNSEQFQSIE